ncbi:hypothetical protein, partial [Mesorhizobium sp.]|uniref:hypothetical protein n=1 Tax=Mesorhizobium sp. TaxID=1871066 RepID=UPI0025DA0F5D
SPADLPGGRGNRRLEGEPLKVAQQVRFFIRREGSPDSETLLAGHRLQRTGRAGKHSFWILEMACTIAGETAP